MAKKKKASKSRTQPSAARTTRKRKPRRPIPLGERPGFKSKTWQELAAEQGVGPFDFDGWMADVKNNPGWPEDESVDDFIAAYRAWRRGEEP